jgi:hypothetical protein
MVRLAGVARRRGYWVEQVRLVTRKGAGCGIGRAVVRRAKVIASRAVRRCMLEV